VRWKHVNLCVDRQYRLLLLFRCCIGSFCISLHFFSLTMMSVTDSIVILFTSPVMTFILGKLILKEPIEHVEFLCALMSYGGVVFVAKPAFLFPSTELNEHHVPMIATVAVLSAAFFQSCTQIAIRLLKPVHFLAITHYFGLFNVGLGLATMAVFKIVRASLDQHLLRVVCRSRSCASAGVRVLD
jgi:drug/metabolite transporter (DMT)-like permease